MPTFAQIIAEKDLLLVDFSAEWCGPCKMMPPILQEVKKLIGEAITVIAMDVDRNPQTAQQYGIQSVPTLMLFQNGKVVWRQSGVVQAHQLEHIIRRFL
ncbi:MAG: thioredoxin [Ignavibacteria bacterium]